MADCFVIAVVEALKEEEIAHLLDAIKLVTYTPGPEGKPEGFHLGL